MSFGKIWKDILGKSCGSLHVLYDHAHNLAKLESHMIEGRKERLLVHRRGATRAFGPESSELPADYQPVGQPLVLLGAMGTPSYLLRGSGLEQTFASSSHGVGRVISFTRGRKRYTGVSYSRKSYNKGVTVEVETLADIGGDDPKTYKNVNSALHILQASGIAYPVARLGTNCHR